MGESASPPKIKKIIVLAMVFKSSVVKYIERKFWRSVISQFEVNNMTNREKLLYDEVHDNRYLKKAVWHIYAFLDFGYPYEKCQRVFDSVLEGGGREAGRDISWTIVGDIRE